MMAGATPTSESHDQWSGEIQIRYLELKTQNESLRQAKEVAENLRAHQSALYDGCPVACLALSESGLIVDINAAGVELLMESREALKRVSFFHFVASEDRDRWEMLYFRALQGQGSDPIEVKIQRNDGSRFEASIEYRREQLIGSLPAMHVTVVDVTERKRVEAELRIAAMAFESHQGMIITDTLGRIIRTNSAFSRLTGFSADEVIGQRPSILQSGRHDKAFYQALWKTIKEDGYWQGEVWNRRKNGQLYAELLTISAITGADGIATNYVGTFSDITKSKGTDA